MSTSKKIQVTRLAHVHYQHPDLTKAATFLNDFGLTCVHKEEGRIYFAGYGVDPFCYIAEQSPENKRKFLGGTWLLASEEDLHLATSHPQASKIQSLDAPGGGQKVSITDPNGATVNFIFGQQLREKTQDNSITRDKDTPTPQLNSAYQKPRQGHWRRFDAGPSPVHKLGHYGYMVPEAKYKETFDFYTSLMNLKPTDSVFHPETQEDKTCFMHIDLGKQFTDHHVSTIVQNHVLTQLTLLSELLHRGIAIACRTRTPCQFRDQRLRYAVSGSRLASEAGLGELLGYWSACAWEPNLRLLV